MTPTANRNVDPNRRLRAAVVGVGRMGQHHARVYCNHKETQLVAVVDHNLERAATIAEKFDCQALRSVDQLLKLS